MNNDNIETQQRLQAAAEQAEKSKMALSSDPEVAAYRLVIRALRQPLPMLLPSDFAARVAHQSVVLEESDGMEDAMTIGLLLMLAIAGLVFTFPTISHIWAQLNFNLPNLPWPMVFATLVAVVFAWGLDRSGWLARIRPML